MSFARPVVDIRAPPLDLDDLIDWFDRVSQALVLLAEFPVAELTAGTDRLDVTVRDHLATAERTLGPADPAQADRSDLRRLLASDHARFEVSLEQLRWFLRRVTEDPQGGHGQALGQYGRVLAEALRRHREDERRYVESVGRAGAAPQEPRRGKP